MKRTPLITILLILLLPALEQRAEACTCAGGDPKKRLARADAAFVGSLISREEPKPAGGLLNSGTGVTWRFKIEKVVKGPLGKEVDVQSPISGASCGFEVELRATVGVLLHQDSGQWSGGLCSQVGPDVLSQAAKPSPVPDGTGPATFLVGGSFGEARLLALDAAGRTLGYGKGEGRTLHKSVCPGFKRLVEVVGPDQMAAAGPDPSLDVRNLRTLESLSSQPLARNAVTGGHIGAVSCLDEAAKNVLLFQTGEPPVKAAILKAQGGRISTIASGDWSSATFDSKKGLVYLGGGQNSSQLETVTLSGGQKRTVAKVPDYTGDWAPSPGGTRLAGVAYGSPSGDNPQPSQFVLVDMTTGAPKTMTASLDRANIAGAPVWLDDKTVVFAPSRGDESDLRVYDTSLKMLASVPGWDGRDPVLVKRTLFGLSHGRLQAVRLPGGPVRELRRFDSPETFSLTALDPGIKLKVQAAEARTQTETNPKGPRATSQKDAPNSEASPAQTWLMVGLGVTLLIGLVVLAVKKRTSS